MTELSYICIAVFTLTIVIFWYKTSSQRRELKRLKEENSYQQTLIDNIPSLIYIKEDGKVIYSNKSFDIVFGHNKVNAYKTLSKLNIIEPQTVTLKFDNDIEKLCKIVATPIFMDGKKRVVHTIIDIDSYHKESQKLIVQKQRFELALRGSQSGLWDWNITNDNIYFCNIWKEIMGYFPHDKPDNLNSWLDLVDSKDIALVNKTLSRHLNQKSAYFEVIHRVKLIEPTRWVSVKGKAIFDNGVAVRMLGIITDITGSIKVENELRKSKKLFETFIDNLPGVAFIKDSKNRYIYINSYYEKYIGYKEWKNKTPMELFDRNIAEVITENDRKAFYEGTKRHEEVIPTEDGSLKYFDSYRFPIENGDNERVLCGFGIDKTKERSYQSRLKLFSQIFDDIKEAVVITDKDGIIVDINRAYEEITGYKKEEMLGKNSNIIKSSKHEKSFFEAIWTSLQKYGKFSGEIFTADKDNKAIPQITSVSAFKDENGKIVNYIVIYHNLKRDKRVKDRYEQSSNYDTLTKLPKRFLFEEKLKISLENVKKSDIKIALIFIDLDDFKWIIDTLGQRLGAEILKEVTKKLKNFISERDMLSRLREDEFVILLEDVINEEQVYNICEKILHILNEPFKFFDETYYINASLGVVIAPDNTSDYDKLLKYADIAMYRAKRAGKNQIEIYKNSAN